MSNRATLKQFKAWVLTLVGKYIGTKYLRLDYLTRGQFNKTLTSVIYKSSYCFQPLKQWLHL